MTLREWRANRWLVDHSASRQEIAELLGVVDREIADARVPGLSADGRFRSAYNAALQIAIAALAAEGYRVAREAHHFRALQTLAFTLETDESILAQLDQFRKKRNIADYERAGAVSDTEVGEMIDVAIRLRDELTAWLGTRHPELA